MVCRRRSDAAKRISQRLKILEMLRIARFEGREVEIPEFLRAGIAHFTTRILELRRRRFVIEDRMWRDDSGRIFSTYRLTEDPEFDADGL